MTSQKKITSRIDYGLVLSLMLLAIVSLIAIYSAQQSPQYNRNFAMLQAFWYGVGTVIIFIVIQFDSEQLKKLAWHLYGFGFLLVVALPFMPRSIAPELNGAIRLYKVPGLGTFQPSEVLKVFLIILLAKIVSDHHHQYKIKTLKTDLWLLIKLGAITMVPAAIIFKQPDLGTALVYVAIFCAIVFVSGINWKIIVPLFGGGLGFAGLMVYIVLWYPDFAEKLLASHQLGRIYSWLDPESYPTEGYHILKSLNAIGSGQTTGKGIGNGEVYIPESHTDFIFSVIGEDFGFIGASIVIGLLFMLIYHITKTGLETKNSFYSYICAGVAMMISFQVFQNIGMTIQLMPITGIQLPFISYGGSGLMAYMMAIGLVFSVRFHYKKYMFATDSDKPDYFDEKTGS
ncbi:FtsW/RodA/SpoVE family cell cycle protein [Bacillus chungangensis]|uniref:Rod shape determining protein RodA n=1 Tax=Bacillus chungangensis TaxID=587633 RepID=A0ABT9WWR3_9BACI|nr:FtsW/RodA/SpoVE family cell cycle protein [Bacillus chungangensis]MDQ0177574.1 rod shape determining protein RodA [Bacillus chungangensis]